jgi:hypothetical protein
VTTIKLISPPEKPAAQQQIQFGYIQHGSTTGSATYSTTPPGGKRTLTTPTANTVDWLSSPSGAGATDEWPWYDSTARATGTGTGTFSKTLTLTDSPSSAIPTKFNPNKASDPNATKPLSAGNETLVFLIRIAARTLDTDLGADKHFFDESHSTWTANYVWPVVAGASIITTGGTWSAPASPTEASVNVVPTAINRNPPFYQWIPSGP